MLERRTDHRAKVVVQVDCRGEHAVALGKSEDLSVGGLLIIASQTLELQTEVDIRFVLPVPPQAITVETHGVVVRSQQGQSMGIQFVDLKPEYRDAIARFVGAPAETPK